MYYVKLQHTQAGAGGRDATICSVDRFTGFDMSHAAGGSAKLWTWAEALRERALEDAKGAARGGREALADAVEECGP